MPVPQPALSQAAVTQPKNFETPVVTGENDKTRPVAPPQREAGNTGGRDDRPQERETPGDLKNEAPVSQIQASASALSGGWTISATAELPAGAAAPMVRATQTADPAPLPAASNTAAPATATSPAVQEIAVRISQPDSPAVDLHVTERAGEIHVAVRTPDVRIADFAAAGPEFADEFTGASRVSHRNVCAARGGGAQMNSRDEKQPQQGFSGRGGSQGESGSGRQKGQREQRGASWLEELEQSK